MTVADDLFEAAAYIDAHGWTQGNSLQPDGSVCAIGAIAAVTAGFPCRWSQRTQDVALALAHHLSMSSTFGVTSWNDLLDPERGHEVVTETMRRCAKGLDE